MRMQSSMLGLMLRDCCLVILIVGAGHAHARACVGDKGQPLVLTFAFYLLCV